MGAPLVSVVVRSHNRAHGLARTVDSALAQTHANLEILVVDDDPVDDMRAVIERAYADEPRVRYLHQPNRGASAARHVGLAAARGDYIGLLDSDDVWLPWKIEAQLRVLDAVPEAGMVWTDMDAVSTDGAVLARRYLTEKYSAYGWFESREDLFERWFPFADVHPKLAADIGGPRVYAGDIFSEMVLGNLIHTSTVLLRRERFERVAGFGVGLARSGEDYDLHLRTCREGPVAYLDAVSILYQRGAEDQATTVRGYKIDMAKNFLSTVAAAIERDRHRIRLPKIMLDEVLAEAHAWIGECHVDRGEHRDATPQFMTSLRYKPKQPRVVAYLAMSLLPSTVGDAMRSAYRFAKKQLDPPATGAP